MSVDAARCPMCGELTSPQSAGCEKCGEGTRRIDPQSAMTIAELLERWTNGTVVTRHIAAVIDNVFAIIASFVAATAIPGEKPLIQTSLLIGTYFAYYLLFEGMLSRTPGKMMNGLVIAQLDGRPCSWKQAFIRTAFRALEVNPVLGALPAAIRVVWARRRQRFGDLYAGTVVVPIEFRKAIA